jgi:hypothetical protein
VLQAPVPEFENSGPILFSPDGRYLAVAGKGAPRSRIDRPPSTPRGVLTRDRETASSEKVGRLIVWDLTGRGHRIVAQAGGSFSALAFAADGSTLAAAREECVDPGEGLKGWKIVRDVRLWSLDSSP